MNQKSQDHQKSPELVKFLAGFSAIHKKKTKKASDKSKK